MADTAPGVTQPLFHTSEQYANRPDLATLGGRIVSMRNWLQRFLGLEDRTRGLQRSRRVDPMRGHDPRGEPLQRSVIMQRSYQ